MNAKKKPFDDPRVRRAFHLVLDKAVLVDVVKDVAPMMVGGFIYPFSEFATPTGRSRQAARLPGRSDGGDQGSQGADGGGRATPTASRALDYLVREVATFKLWSQAIQAMLQQTLNIETQPAHRRRVGLVRRHQDRQLRPGHRRHRVDAARPVRLLQCLVQDGRPAELLELGQCRSSTSCCRKIDTEVDPKKRLEYIRQAEAIMEENPPLLPMSLGEDQRRLVQLREGPQPEGLLRHLRRRALGHLVARQVAIRSRAGFERFARAASPRGYRGQG